MDGHLKAEETRRCIFVSVMRPWTTHSCGLALPLVAEVIALRQNADISTRVFFCLIIKLHNGVQKGDEMLFDTKAV